jgi:membrane protein required for colicin V production
VVLCFCLIRGIFRGLIKEVSSIVGVLGGFYAAYTYYPRLAKIMSSWISNPGYLNILSFMIIFCVVLIIISILGIIIKYLLNIAFLGWVDRICGAGFSLLKGVLIVSVVLLILTAFLPQGAALVKQSLLAPHVVLVSEKMSKVVSKDMKHAFTENLKELKKTWTPTKK